MKRWHSPRERAIMLRRWREEITNHEDPFHERPWPALPPIGEEQCHCYRGMGFVRKKKPGDCGKARCGVCHFGKWGPKGRGNALRQAIELEERACG